MGEAHILPAAGTLSSEEKKQTIMIINTLENENQNCLSQYNSLE